MPDVSGIRKEITGRHFQAETDKKTFTQYLCGIGTAIALVHFLVFGIPLVSLLILVGGSMVYSYVAPSFRKR